MNLERSIQQLDDSAMKRSLIRMRYQAEDSMMTNNSTIYSSQSNVTSVIAKQKTDQLYHYFLSVIQSRSNEMEIFETVFDLRQALENIIDEMESSKNIKIGADSWIRQEMNTWSLLYCLYKDRLITQKEEMETDDLPLTNSEKNIVEHLYSSKLIFMTITSKSMLIIIIFIF